MVTPENHFARADQAFASTQMILFQTPRTLIYEIIRATQVLGTVFWFGRTEPVQLVPHFLTEAITVQRHLPCLQICPMRHRVATRHNHFDLQVIFDTIFASLAAHARVFEASESGKPARISECQGLGS